MHTPRPGLLAGVLTLALLAEPTQAQKLGKSGGLKGLTRGNQPATSVTDVIDFEGLPAGTVLSTVYGKGGAGPIIVRAYSPAFGAGTNAAVVFDSEHRTGGDSDLGTPNSDFGGPGIDGNPGDGLEGEAGSPYENDLPQGNVLIIAEDLVDADNDTLIDDPDDGDLPGSLYTFDFGSLGGVTVHQMLILDVEADEGTATVQFFDAASQPMGSTVLLPKTGCNGRATVDLGDVSGVFAMAVSLNGSGAIDDIAFSTTPPCGGRIGSLVWRDEDCDGLQDDEPGIPGVKLILKDRFGGFVASTTTDSSGNYLFTDLCAGRYTVWVDESTLPPGLEPAPCDQGSNDRIDSECSPYTTFLDPGEIDRTVDFGYCDPPDQGGEGCTPGYWKQPHHFDSWPAGYDPWMEFSDVFDDGAFPGKTLLDVLKQGGGGLKALGRHTVAALLNGTSPNVDYGPSGSDVIEMFNDEFPGGDYKGLKDIFEDLNESGCPLN